MHKSRLLVCIVAFVVSPCRPQFEALLAQQQGGGGAGQTGGNLEGACLPGTTTTSTTTTTTPTTTASTTPKQLTADELLTTIFSRLPLWVKRRLINSLAKPELSAAKGNRKNFVKPTPPTTTQQPKAAKFPPMYIDPRFFRMMNSGGMSPRREGVLSGRRFPPGRRMFESGIMIPPHFLRRVSPAVAQTKATTTTTTTSTTTTPQTFNDPYYDFFDPLLGAGALLHDGTQVSEQPRVRRKRQGLWGLGSIPVDPSTCTCHNRLEVMVEPEFTPHPSMTCNSPELICACLSIYARK